MFSKELKHLQGFGVDLLREIVSRLQRGIVGRSRDIELCKVSTAYINGRIPNRQAVMGIESSSCIGVEARFGPQVLLLIRCVLRHIIARIQQASR